MRKWSDMASLSKPFRDKIDKLEGNFAVSTLIFKKYEPIFLDIFVHPAQDPTRQQGGRKQRRQPCTSNEVFKFAWTMFVQVKGYFPAISDDRVNSYYLLLCCVDWIFANAVLGGRRDLLNPDFAGLPEDFHRLDWKAESVPCIMQLLCETHEGLVVEAKTIKEDWWKPHIKRLFEKKLLKGKVDTLSGILEMGSFEENVKMTNNFYEEYVLSVGDFDERIFLGEDANEEIGTPGGPSNASALTEQMQAKRSLKQHFDEEKDLSVTPVSTATQSISRLQALPSGTKTSPSDNLKDSFNHEEISHSHARDPVSSGNRLPSKEFYELIKRTPRTFNEDDSSSKSKQSSKVPGSQADCLKVDRFMIWNQHEAYELQYEQIAVSACGQTAVLNVLKALKFPFEESVVCEVIKHNLRKNDKDIPEYLFSRSCAGTTAADLMAGVSKLTGDVIGGRFFHFWPARKVKLLQWLAYWMKRGAIPMATLNLQQGPHSIWEVPDSWHHQMVYGVTEEGLYLTNPLEIVSERSAIKQLCSDSVLLVRRQDIVSRFRESTDLGQLLDHPDLRWMSFNVLEQVDKVLKECSMPSVPQFTSHVRIPASYKAGITLFMKKDKPDWNALVTASEFPLA